MQHITTQSKGRCRVIRHKCVEIKLAYRGTTQKITSAVFHKQLKQLFAFETLMDRGDVIIHTRAKHRLQTVSVGRLG